jgi:hypothetical protein
MYELMFNQSMFNQSSLQEVIKVERAYFDLLINHWYENEFLTFNWWVLFFLTIVPPIIWWRLLDKNRSFEIITFGLFLGTIAAILDSIGSVAHFWIYPVRLSPYLNPQFYPYDISLVIIPFMLTFQYFPDKKKFRLSIITVSAFIAFIAEPFMAWLGVYHQITWKHVYSFFIYYLIALFCRWIIGFLKKKATPIT